MKRFGYLSIFIAMSLITAPVLAQDADSRPDTGIIYGAQYVNSYFGFSYRFPAAWSAAAGRTNVATRIYPLFTASPSASGDGRYVAIEAERIRRDGSVRTSKDFLALQVEMLSGPSTGFDALPGDKRYTFGGREFDRIDLRSKAAPGAALVHQALVATIVRDYAITFLFKASSDVELDDLVRTLESLSFLDSGPAPSQMPSPSTPASRTLEPLVATNSSTTAAPPATVSSASHVAPQPPAASAPRNPQPATTPAPASNTPAVTAPVHIASQPESANTSGPAGAPSTLIKMANAPHTIPGDTLPPTEVETPPQPLVKAPPKADPATKTAVMQAVMPSPSATMSPAVLNTSVSTSQPPASTPQAAVAQPAAAAPSVSAPAPAARKPAFTVQTEITRVQISGETLESYVIRKVPAMYPALARQARIEGLVVLSIVVDEKGEVQDVKAISGPPLLARSAEDALRHWRFRPIIIDGKPTQVESRVSMNFQFPH
jgi:protein TonB